MSLSALPDYKLPFVSDMDASAFEFCAFLMQKDACSKHLASAYANRTLNHAESNYYVTPIDTGSCMSFPNIILSHSVTVFTDHAVIIELFKGRNLIGKLAR